MSKKLLFIEIFTVTTAMFCLVGITGSRPFLEGLVWAVVGSFVMSTIAWCGIVKGILK